MDNDLLVVVDGGAVVLLLRGEALGVGTLVRVGVLGVLGRHAGTPSAFRGSGGGLVVGCDLEENAGAVVLLDAGSRQPVEVVEATVQVAALVEGRSPVAE